MEFPHSTLKSDKEFILPAVKVPMTDYQPPVKKSQNPNLIYKDFTQGATKEQRKSYLARARAIRDKQGNLTANDKNSANYWSIRVLWKG